jgi:hypothetical protein
VAALVCSPALPALASQVTIYGWSTSLMDCRRTPWNACSSHPQHGQRPERPCQRSRARAAGRVGLHVSPTPPLADSPSALPITDLADRVAVWPSSVSGALRRGRWWQARSSTTQGAGEAVILAVLPPDTTRKTGSDQADRTTDLQGRHRAPPGGRLTGGRDPAPAPGCGGGGGRPGPRWDR